MQPVNPDQPGPYAAGYIDEQIAGASGDSPNARIYYPAQTAGEHATPHASGHPYPVAVYNHGFRFPVFSFGISYRNNAFITEWLASYGYVVICVDMASNNDLFDTGQANSQRDADDTVAAIDHLAGLNTNINHPLKGLIDATRVGVAGHSRGGDGALMGASADVAAGNTRVKAIAVLGPPAFDSQNKNTPLNFGVFSSVPMLAVAASADAVAPPSDQAAILAQAGSPSMQIEIEGGNHSQYKDNSWFILGDNRATIPLADQQAIVRRYVTAWFETHVRGSRAYAAYIMNGAEVVADSRLRSYAVR